MKTPTKTNAFTHIGFAEYKGQQYIYSGNFEPCAIGAVEDVISYLESLDIPDDEESLSWPGSNGRWYSGDYARSLIAGEIQSLRDGTHFSLETQD